MIRLRLLLLATPMLFSCQPQNTENTEISTVDDNRAEAKRSTLESQQPPLFVEKAAATGLIFQHYSGASGRYHMPEILGSGVALFDYDNDGDIDVYLVQGSDIDQDVKANIGLPVSQTSGNKLFANQLKPTGELKFIDVTNQAQLNDTFYGMGVAVADYDNDGDNDLYVAGFEENALYRNDGGIFKRIKNAGGAQDTRWTSSVSFCDVNGDQWPDLYLANYIFYSPTQKVICRDTLGQEDYCSPDSYKGAGDSLYLNQQDGTFLDVSDAWGVASEASTGLGVLCRDFNHDGLQDIYVANDSMSNLLWINQDSEGFVNEADIQGAAINMNGQTEGSMGVTAGDFDGDGDDDLFITHWNNETNTIYRNDEDIGFLDITTAVNLAAPSLSHTGFGTDWIDFDNDGDLDLFIANGAVQRYVDSSGALSSNYGQKNQLLRNDDGRRFSDVSSQLGDQENPPLTGRGAAFGDVDNDGDVDVVVSNKDGPVQLYLNQVGQQSHWVGLQLIGVKSNRDAQGAIVEVQELVRPSDGAHNAEDLNTQNMQTGDQVATGGRQVRRVIRLDGSYQSAHDPRLVIGLGDNAHAVTVLVRWPNGEQQTFDNLQPDQYHLLKEH